MKKRTPDAFFRGTQVLQPSGADYLGIGTLPGLLCFRVPFPYSTGVFFHSFVPTGSRPGCFPLVSHSSAWDDPRLKQTDETMLSERALQSNHTSNSTEKARVTGKTKRPTVRTKKRCKVTVTVPKKAQRRRVVPYITPVWMDPSFGCAARNGPPRPCGAWSSGRTARRGLSKDIVGTSLNWGAMKPLPPAP